jgi:hypothetical protein
MKTFMFTLAVILLLSFPIAGCKKDSNKDESKKNLLLIDGTEYAISKGYLEYYGLNGSGFNIDLTLFSSGISIDETMGMPSPSSGSGNMIYFEMYSPDSDKLAQRDYAYNSAGNSGSFDLASYILDWNIAVEPDIDFIPITAGTVKVIKNGTEYELSFSGTDQNNKVISVYYKGSLKFYTIPENKRSLKFKQQRNRSGFKQYSAGKSTLALH